ncbi:MAG: Ig-like domain-containing protein [Clostridiales bacterium]|nr:Ig-like domain-containing protein [Clostridiales bacterium]MBQ5824330.1 Ig-like domain-containing protein [Clostridia bacterium]
MAKIVEFRGCDHLVVAEVTKDDATGYTVGAITSLAPVAEIAKTTENSSETHFYDNVGAIVIKAEGSDEVTLTVPALNLDQLAKVTGKSLDPQTGAYVDDEGVEKSYAIGYRIKLTDGSFRYVWRLKGVFSNVPDEDSTTESNNIDTNNQSVVFTGNKTVYDFQAGSIKGHAKAIVIDERDGLADVSKFFDQVVTPDNLASLAKATTTAISLSSSSEEIVKDNTATITATTTPSGQHVVWSTSNSAVATVAGGVITAVAVGTAVITATSGNYSASCTVTVTAGA